MIGPQSSDALVYLLLALGATVLAAIPLGIGLYSLYCTRYGGPELNPLEWPTTKARVVAVGPLSFEAASAVHDGVAHVELSGAYARVHLTTPQGDAIKRVSPPVLRSVQVRQPSNMTKWEFENRLRVLAVLEGQAALPTGAEVLVRYNPKQLQSGEDIGAHAVDLMMNSYTNLQWIWMFVRIGLSIGAGALMAWVAFFRALF